MKKLLLLLAAVGVIFTACENLSIDDPQLPQSGEVAIPNNEIWYTSSNGKIVTPNATDVFGANIVSNTYENGKGITSNV